MKWLQKWKERKRLKQRQSTRQLMGIRKLLPHGVAIPGGSLVFFLIHPDNLSVLSAEGIRQRVTALSNLFRAEEQVEVLGLDSRESFQQNQVYYQTRLEEETTPKIRELLQKDISYLDEIQTTSASSREFVLVLRMEEQAALDEGGLRQKEKSLCDHGISVRLAEEQDVKRLLVSYYLHDADPESLEDVDIPFEEDIFLETHVFWQAGRYVSSSLKSFMSYISKVDFGSDTGLTVIQRECHA